MNKNKNPFVSYSEFFTKLDSNTEKVSPEILDMKFKDLTNDRNNISNSPSDNASRVSNGGSSDNFNFTKPVDSSNLETNRANMGQNQKNELKKQITSYINSLDIENDYKKYLIRLAERESNFNPEVINAQGFKGLFQFGDDALRDIGMTTSDYMSDWKKQIDAVIKFTNLNRERLRNTLRGTNGKDIDGTKINEWGLLGAAHLGGVGGVNKFLFKGANPVDANNTSIKDYLIYFSK